MTGKNVKERIGLGGMDADRIREIMGEAPACPRKRRGMSGNDIIRPAALHRKLSILAGASRNGKVTLEGFINHLVSRHLEEYRETTDMILEESLPGPVIKARPP